MSTLFRVEGKMSTFGGPKDTGMKPDEGIALFSSPQDMKNHGLADYVLSEADAGAPGLGRRLNPKKAYLACFWDYAATSREFLRNHVAWVENPKTGQRLQARPVDFGPAKWTNRVADLSPGLAELLGLDTNDVCRVTITEESSEFGADFSHHFVQPLVLTGPRIFTTDEWGAKPPKVSHFPEKAAEGIVVHNTEGANRDPYADPDKERETAFANARQIQQDHFKRPPNGWSDTGQHFTISQGGIICEGRHGTLEAAKAGHVVRGAHAPGANDEWWGIEVAGDNRQKFVVTDPQWTALVSLCVWLTKLAGKTVAIQPHDHFKDTSCPGKIKEHLDELRKAVAAGGHA